jgi:hypothetical protein
MVYGLFNALLNLVYKGFSKKFCIYVHQRNSSVVFFVMLFSGFDIRVKLAFRMSLKQMLARMWGKRNLHTLLVGMKASMTTLENITEASLKTKHRSAV